MAKRGRKPNLENRKGYFYEEEEEAVKNYLASTDDKERNRIFETKLHQPFCKMIESIIHRYKLYVPDEPFEDIFNDTYSFLLMKIHNFDPSNGAKAYSYCGTICKNYLIHKSNQYIKNRNRNISYEDISYDIDENEKYSYLLEEEGISPLKQLIDEMIDEINQMLDPSTKPHLNTNEVKIGQALLELLSNWEDLFIKMGSNKFNKNSILFFLKETTLLSTKEIRDSIKKYKKRYYIIKDKIFF